MLVPGAGVEASSGDVRPAVRHGETVWLSLGRLLVARRGAWTLLVEPDRGQWWASVRLGSPEAPAVHVAKRHALLGDAQAWAIARADDLTRAAA